MLLAISSQHNVAKIIGVTTLPIIMLLNHWFDNIYKSNFAHNTVVLKHLPLLKHLAADNCYFNIAKTNVLSNIILGIVAKLNVLAPLCLNML